MSDDTSPPTQYDWSAHYDDAQRLYYYNSVTDESSWDPPADGLFNPPTLEDSTIEDTVDDTVGANETSPPNQDTNELSEDSAPMVNVVAAAVTKPGETAVSNEEKEEVSTVVPPPNEDEEEQFDWSAYYDDEGRIYYYNRHTEESVWEPPPEGFHPPPENDDEIVDAPPLQDNQNDTPNENAEANAVPTSNEADTKHPSDDPKVPVEPNVDDDHPNDDTTATATPWIAYQDDEGREYYYNSETGETQWDEPESYRRAEEDHDNNDDDDVPPDADETNHDRVNGPQDSMDDHQKSTGHADDGTTNKETMDFDIDETANDVSMEVEVDPAVQRLKDAEAVIYSPDSILEPKCMEHVSELVQADGGNASRAISALIDHYYGQTAVCGLLTRWYLDLGKHNAPPPLQRPTTKDSQLPSSDRMDTNAAANHIRQVIQNVITKVAKEKYTKEAGDSILDLSKSEVTFLEEMMDSSRWRQLLIDLSASHKDSAVLLYCLRAISKRGHHREIAQRINISDHFTVFNAMLLSELSVIGQQAISAVSDLVAATTFQELVPDIIKACTATSYTYLYSIQMLRTLIQMSKADFASFGNNSGSSPLRFQRAILKWEAVLQLLECSMMDSSNIKLLSGSSTSSPLLRRRQLEVTLTISDLHQRQRSAKRKRLAHHNDSSEAQPIPECDRRQDRLDVALSMLLKRHSMGIQIDDSVLDKLLPLGLDVDTGGVGKLLIQYPMALQALLMHLYKPGPTRITSPSTKNKCARLIALSMFAAEDSVRNKNDATNNHFIVDGDNNAGVEEPARNEVTVTQQIVQGSLYCEQLETMISFLVATKDSDLTESRRQKSLLTVGEKLCLLALSLTPVGLGVVMWAREFTHGKEYAASASYPTLSDSILSLVRIVALRHPFARSDALHVGLAFLRHTNSEVSYQKVNSIKECALRLLIFLIVEGDIVPVLSALTERVQQIGTSELGT